MCNTREDIEGHGCGYFVAVNSPRRITIDVAHESEKAFAGRETPPHEWFNRKLEELKAHDERFW